MLMTDIRELKAVLDIPPDDTVEDKKLWFLIEQASNWIEEFLGRPGMSYKSRTEYYGGTNTQKLLLRSRPAYAAPAIQCFVDDAAYWGSATGAFAAATALTYGSEFALKIDQEDGVSSRSGILIRINSLWPRRAVRYQGLLSPSFTDGHGNIKVVYSGGYTVDNLPAVVRWACNILVARMRLILPLGVELGGEGYEGRSISIVTSEKAKLLALVAGPLTAGFNDWRW